MPLDSPFSKRVKGNAVRSNRTLSYTVPFPCFAIFFTPLFNCDQHTHRIKLQMRGLHRIMRILGDFL